MSGRPRVFDGFCKAGGAGAGYARAGFQVFSMDIEPQPRTPDPQNFLQYDVMEMLRDPAGRDFMREFDLLHFSPPCQGYTSMRHAKGAKGPAAHPLLISEIRELVLPLGVPFVIENVEEAAWDMRDPVCLCGSMFGLRAPEGWLRRHRMFEASFPLGQPVCRHDETSPVLGVYGGHVRRRAHAHGGRGTSEAGWLRRPHRELAGELMGIDWMSMSELDEAIPPDYTRWVAEEFLLWNSKTQSSGSLTS